MKDPIPPADPILLDIIERRLAPYLPLLSPAQAERFREEAIIQLTHHPYPAALIRQLRVSATGVETKESGVLPKGGSGSETMRPSEEQASGGRRGGRR